MQSDGVRRVKMARYRRHRNQLFDGCLDVCADVAELVAAMGAILMVAVPAGIGIGWGLAFISALM